MTQALKSTQQTTFSYTPPTGLYDEMVADGGEIRAAWQYIHDSLGGMDAADLDQRRQKALRILRDDGATYNVYDSDRGDNTWRLDLIPWVVPSDEWTQIEAGLQERAELFNLILSDIYTDRELISRGILPPELILGHKAFLRPCQGISLPGEHQLIVHSADLLRRPDGSICLLADRTQAPSGAGYALENRTVMSRVLPSLFRDSHVHRIAAYFRSLRQKLMELMPHVQSPRIVVLTPGAYNEAYFEHSYLANYLGFALVQSADLVVRDGYVWMKSLDGLNRVDVILRRVDDYFCDQVELKGDSQLGVAGLLEVVRAGRVAIANPLGSGILENPALLRYLPRISEHFLGRKLRLNTVATWWCGEPDDLAHVLANLDQFIVKPVFRAPGAHSVVVSRLSDGERAKLVAAIKSRPDQYVAQEKLLPSHLPVIGEGRLEPRPALLRTFAVASEGAYRVMPGGLTRVGADQGSSLISSQVGAVSKDTWVLASEPEKQTSLWTEAQRDAMAVGQNTSLPSRVVENLFWLGRYAERAENGLRLMRTALMQTNGADQIPPQAKTLLLEAVARQSASAPGFVSSNKSYDAVMAEMVAVITDRRRMGSVSGSINSMLYCAEQSKELLSSDTQRIINDIRDLNDGLDSALRSSLVSAPEEVLDPLVSSLLAFSGIVHESMIRGMGWRFIDMGRRLERAMQTVTLMRALLVRKLPEADEAVVLESLLMTIEALISYRRRYRASLNMREVLELSLIDTSNPRSVLYQLECLEEHVADLPEAAHGSRELEDEQRSVLEALSLIRLSNLATLSAVNGETGARQSLDQLFARINYLLSETSNRISGKFFDHSKGPQQLVTQKWGLE